MTLAEIRKKCWELTRQLAYEPDPAKIAVLQGRLQVALETMDKRGVKWT